METNDNSTQASTGLRPTFLTVLCILTFIGSGYGVIKAVDSYLTADSVAAMTSEVLNKAKDQSPDPFQSNVANNMLNSLNSRLSPDNIRQSSLITLLSSLLTLFGGIMMLRLMKTGFFVYIAGCVIAVFAPMIILGIGFLGGVASMITALICLVFIIMYGVNVKYMTR